MLVSSSAIYIILIYISAIYIIFIFIGSAKRRQVDGNTTIKAIDKAHVTCDHTLLIKSNEIHVTFMIVTPWLKIVT